MKHSLDADGEPLRLGRPLSDEVRAAAVGLEEVVGLLALHVPREPTAKSTDTEPGDLPKTQVTQSERQVLDFKPST